MRAGLDLMRREGYLEASDIAMRLSAAGVTDPLALSRALAVCANLGRTLDELPQRVGDLLAKTAAAGVATRTETYTLRSWGLSTEALLRILAAELGTSPPAATAAIIAGKLDFPLLLTVLEAYIDEHQASVFENNLRTITALAAEPLQFDEATWRRANPGYPATDPVLPLRPGLVAHRARTPRLRCRLGLHRATWSLEPPALLSMITWTVRTCNDCHRTLDRRMVPTL